MARRLSSPTARGARSAGLRTAPRRRCRCTWPRPDRGRSPAAARHAEGVDLTLGADLDRLRWGAATARRAGPSRITVGAYLNVAVDPDRDGARTLVRGSVATFARFSADAHAVVGYDKERHGEAGAAFAQRLEDEFVDRFAVAGTAEEVRDRLVAMAPAGIDRLIIVPGSLDSDTGAVRQSLDRFARDVLPSLTA